MFYRSTAFIAFLLLMTASRVGAVTIIFDDFNDPDGTVVRNTTPPIGNTWGGSPGFTVLDNSLRSNTSGSGHLLTIDMGADYFINNSAIYTLTATVFFATDMTTQTDNFMFGFNNGTNASAGANRQLSASDGFGGRPAIRLTGTGAAAVYDTPGNQAFTTATGAYAAGQEHELKLVLNTMDENWSIQAFVNDEILDIGGPGIDTITYVTNPTIRYVAISSNVTGGIDGDSAKSYLDIFQLEAVVPEPSTYAMLLGALVGMVVWMRRCR